MADQYCIRCGSPQPVGHECGRDRPKPPTDDSKWTLPPDPFDIVEWMDWEHVPSCPCDDCEDYRRDNGLTCMYGVGPRPEGRREHNWAGQWMLAGGKVKAQESGLDSAPDTGSEG